MAGVLFFILRGMHHTSPPFLLIPGAAMLGGLAGWMIEKVVMRHAGPGFPSGAAAFGEAGRVVEVIPQERLLQLFRQSSARERLLGPEHSATMAARDALAGAYLMSGRAAEAIPLYEQTFAARERLLGPDHPRTRGTRDALALARRQAGQ